MAIEQLIHLPLALLIHLLLLPKLLRIARKNGNFAYIDNGINAWAAIHKLDAATVFRLALEKNIIPGTRYHAVAESQIFLKDLTQSLSKKMELPVMSIIQEEAKNYFEGFIHFAQLNIPISSEKTQNELNWKPLNATLFDDIEYDIYS